MPACNLNESEEGRLEQRHLCPKPMKSEQSSQVLGIDPQQVIQMPVSLCHDVVDSSPTASHTRSHRNYI